ncbi:hypothetical protein RB595_006940 [Gaeumannomyces hyphopodioides]
MAPATSARARPQAHASTSGRAVKRSAQSACRSSWLFDNQFALSCGLVALPVLGRHAPGRTSLYADKFATLSYYNPRTGLYAVGMDDLCFVAFLVLVLTGLRAGLMQHILSPLAQWLGATGTRQRTRFAEQGWMFLYYLCFWPLGLYLYASSPYFLNLHELWTEWPQRELSGLAKGYMLAQWAYWVQQVLVVNMEARRSDYWQMIIHHAVTVSLIAASYFYHHTRVGTLILVLMDVSELFFPCLKCAGFTKCCDIAFGTFVVTWLVARHVLCLMVCWSIYAHTPRTLPLACFRGSAGDLEGPLPLPAGWRHLLEPFRNPGDGMVCHQDSIRIAFLFYLLLMQIIIGVWSAAMIRVAARVLRGSNAEDVRSDSEEEAPEEADEKDQGEQWSEPLEREVAVEAADLQRWGRQERRAGAAAGPVSLERTAAGASTSFSLHRQADRKELLNRIGCEKQID